MSGQILVGVCGVDGDMERWNNSRVIDTIHGDSYVFSVAVCYLSMV